MDTVTRDRDRDSARKGSWSKALAQLEVTNHLSAWMLLAINAATFASSSNTGLQAPKRGSVPIMKARTNSCCSSVSNKRHIRMHAGCAKAQVRPDHGSENKTSPVWTNTASTCQAKTKC